MALLVPIPFPLSLKNADTNIDKLDLTIAGKDYEVSFDDENNAEVKFSISADAPVPRELTIKTLSLSANASAKDQDGNTVTSGSTVKIATSDNDQSITLTVTAEDGSTSAYTISLIPQNADANIDSLDLVISGKNYAVSFDDENNAEVKFSISADAPVPTELTIKTLSLSADASAKDQDGNTVTSGSTVKIATSGNDHSITLTVTAKDGTISTYTISLIRQNSDTNIDKLDLTIAGKDYEVSFDENNAEVKFGVSSGNTVPRELTIKTLSLSADASAKDQDGNTVTSGSTVKIATSGNDHSITLTVTAKDGSTSTYTITLIRQNTDADVDSLTLTIAGKDYEVSFDGTGNATIAISASLAKPPTLATVKEIAVSSGAAAKQNSNTISAGDTVLIAEDGGVHSISFSVTSEDGSITLPYNIAINISNTDADVDSLTLTIAGKDYAVSFDGTGNATITVSASLANPLTLATVKDITVSSGATVKQNTNTISAGSNFAITGDGGVHSISFSVTSEDGSITTAYSIGINISNSDANVDKLDLTIEGEDYAVSFDGTGNATIAISASLANPPTLATVKDIAVSSGAAAKQNGNTIITGSNFAITGDDGARSISFSVTSEDGSITLPYNIAINISNSDANIDSLTLEIAGKDYAVSFDDENNAEVKFGMSANDPAPTQATVKEITVSSGATVKQNGNTITASKIVAITGDAGARSITLTVAAEDGTTSTYTITLIRQNSDANVDKLDLTIEGEDYEVSFDGTGNATITISASLANPPTLATVKDIAVSSGATAKQNSNTIITGSNFAITGDDGAHSISFSVTSEDGSLSRAYNIDINISKADVTVDSLTLEIAGKDYDVSFDDDNNGQVKFGISSKAPAPEELTIKTLSLSGNVSATDHNSKTVRAGSTVAIRTWGIYRLITLTVTATDGSSRTYTITLARQNSDANIDSLTLKIAGKDYEVPFSDTGNATIAAPVSPTSPPEEATIESISFSPDASVKDKDNNIVNTDSTVSITTSGIYSSITLKVTAEDGSTRTYTINIIFVNGDAAITNLRLAIGGRWNYVNFDNNDRADITVTIPSPADIPSRVYAEVSVSAGASVTDGTGATVTSDSLANLVAGEGRQRILTLVVTDANAFTRTYTVFIQYVNMQANIDELTISVDQNDYSVPFDNNGTASVDISSPFASFSSGLTVKSISFSVGASVKDQDGNTVTTDSTVAITTRDSDHSITLTVTAEDGSTTRTYTIILIPANDPRLNDVTMSLNGAVYPVTFDKDYQATFNVLYRIRANDDIATFRFTPTSGATVEYAWFAFGQTIWGHLPPDADWHLHPTSGGEAKTIILRISKDGLSREYTITLDYIDPITLSGHTSVVASVAFSPDGTRLASGSFDKSIRIWDMTKTTPTSIHTLTEHNDWVNSVAFSPDGTRIASGSDDDSIKIWDMEQTTPTSIHTLTEHGNYVNSVAFSPDGTRLASGSEDNTIRIWDMTKTTPTSIHTLTEHNDWVRSVAFSPDGTRLASGSYKSIRIWDMTKTTPTSIHALTGHTDYVESVAFSPDGTRLASGSEDNTIRIWDMTKTTPTSIHTLTGHTGTAYSVAFSPDGTRLASSSFDKSIRIWDMEQTTPTSIHTLTGHTRDVWSVASVAFSPDGTRLASGGWDETIKIWR